MNTRYLATPAAVLTVVGVGFLAGPAHASAARPSHRSTSADCQFRDGAAARIVATWFDDPGGKSVYEQVYRTASGGGDLEVTSNRYDGDKRGPGGLPVTWYVDGSSGAVLSVTITDDLGAQCHKNLS